MSSSGKVNKTAGVDQVLAETNTELAAINNWTPEQLEAINGRGGNLLVAAAAGAGKTAVLVERIIRRITDPDDPVDLDRLLVLTFTSAAASEMRERIGRALAEQLAGNTSIKHLKRQMSLLNRAWISTIHSFCLDILRRHFYRIDLDPAFRVADESEVALIRADALAELFEQRYAAGDNCQFNALVDCYGGNRDDTVLQELVLNVYQFARSTPRPVAWLQNMACGFDIPAGATFDQLPWSGTIKNALKLVLAGLVEALDLAIQLAVRPGAPQAYLDNLEAEREQVQDLAQACDMDASWDEIVQSFSNVSFGRLKAVKKTDADENLKKQITTLRDQVKKRITYIKNTYFARQPDELCDDLRRVAPLITELAALVQDFDQVYRQAKTAHGVVDFSDLEHYCLQVLTDEGPAGPAPSAVALELRDQITEVMVDEYQDTNAVQEEILRLVSRQGESSPNLFMVGDVKQSIYSFRLAEPGLFLNKYMSYPSLAGGPDRKIDLVKNFRSRRGVIDAVNFVFRQLMTPAISRLAYDQKAELAYGAGYPAYAGGQPEGEPVEFYLIERNSSGDSQERNDPEQETGADSEANELNQPEEDLDAVQMEACLIAGLIKDMVNSPSDGEPGQLVYDNDHKTYRPVTYRDIVVLMRATSGYANSFIEEFRQAGVPAYADSATGYFEATEVETMLSLLKVIDNPRQDVPLAGVLRSPIVGFDAMELAEIKLYCRQGDFYDAVVAAATLGQGALSDCLTAFLEKLERWRTAARQGALSALIWMLYRETGYYDFVGGLPGGEQRQANLRVLHHRALQYEATAFRGLFLFLRFIERIQEEGRDLGMARTLSEKENVVRIMSIHKSKGLEFPVVIVAGLGKKFNFKDLNSSLLLHKDLGFGPQIIDVENRITYPTIAKLALQHELKMESMAEEMRILYVAMTRAREKLILVGSARNLPECAQRWCNQMPVEGWGLPDGALASAKTYLDWLGPALARHQDGLPIRQLALCHEHPQALVACDPSLWIVSITDGCYAAQAKEQIESDFLRLVRRMEPLEPPGELAGTIKEMLNWCYPDHGLAGYAAKSSVTGLVHRTGFETGQLETARDEVARRNFHPATAVRPKFLQKKQGLTAAEAGTALHLVMQNLDFNTVADAAAIEAQVAAMVERELLTGEQARSVPVGKIAAFFKSPLGKRVVAGRKVWRELPFTRALPVNQVYPEVQQSNQVVLVQGVIDCLIDEGEDLLLLDYKTDRISLDQLEQLVILYSNQINLYAGAVESIFKRRVSEKYLYFFNIGIEVKCL
ncbi:MAG: ATP-dependent helicase/nuclease subunit A [Pelotomaculum sp. PtaB.Bin104]|nr:MAG: ATP-dependent helicase/nuclease subunit A [Pelotomaculum sp. PtaB.Bin104]